MVMLVVFKLFLFIFQNFLIFNLEQGHVELPDLHPLFRDHSSNYREEYQNKQMDP